jgi:uroporphyrinogen decarboxylase
MNMKKWLEETKDSKVKKAIPVLSFPSIQLLNIGVKELISSSEMQAKGMKMIADRVNAAASLSMMDLSVEAEAFGSEIRVSDDEVPTVIGRIVKSVEDAKALKVPEVTAGRTNLYVNAIKLACGQITDRPVFAGTIGPFSLAGRLMDVSEIMINCYEEPEMVHITLKKVTEFLINYIKAYKATGANGVVMAEPLAGILSPALIEEFSTPYVRKIADAVQDDDFILIYHNCGNNTIILLDSILKTGASAFHFGNAIDMEEMVKKFPRDKIVMGNIDPASQFRNGTPESVRKATLELLEKCSGYSNFVISSGCDIPPLSKWENIDAFFAAVDEYYNK